MNKKFFINYPIIILILLALIAIYHYRYFLIPVNKRYTFEKIFLYDNGNMGPVSVDALNSAVSKNMFVYRYKWEEEVGYIVFFEDQNSYQSYKNDYLDIHADFEPIKTYIRHEYKEGKDETAPRDILTENGFDKNFIDSFVDINKYHTLYSYVSIRKQLHVDNDVFIEYVFYNDSEKSLIHVIRQYKPSDR